MKRWFWSCRMMKHVENYLFTLSNYVWRKRREVMKQQQGR